MKVETGLSFTKMQDQAQYDAAVKTFFKHKEAVAPILARVVREYAGYTNKEIVSFIDADIRAEEDPVDGGLKDIVNRNTEMKSLYEKVVYYDLKFEAKNPKLSNDKILVMLHIDLEFQNQNYPSGLGYPLEMRAMYYAARELSSQLSDINRESRYDKLEKVYSIWVCSDNIPVGSRDTITRYYIQKEDLLGTTKYDPRFDLMEVALIRRGGDNANGDVVLDYLKGVFEHDISKVEEYLGPVDTTVKEDFSMMTGFAQALEAEAEARGEARGEERGRIEGGNHMLYKLVQDGELSIETAARNGGVSVEEFKKNMSLCGYKLP
ncbi:MAG: hypothetical protein IJT16_10930 [Lachnospiraceae bacterium]|nr:hypothetical protein [Lachnospiraceae bacterium]